MRTDRGAVLALVLSVAASAGANEALRETLSRLHADQSYVLVERPDEAPRLILLSPGDGSEPPAPDPALIDAIKALGSDDAGVREDAVLRLDDLGADPALLIGAFDDPSADVRDAALAVLEDRAESAR